MPQTINTNLASLNAQRNLNTSQSSLATSLQRLSSGLRINSAKDDAAGLAISERMGAQVRGLNQAARNSNDAISLAQTAEGNLSEIANILQRMREISVQSANDTNTTADRTSLNNEVVSLSAEIDRIAGAAQFNGSNLLDGTFSSATFQVGANATQSIAMSLSGSRTTDLGIGGTSAVTGDQAGTVAITNTGAMTINGTTIGASSTDSVSYVGGSLAGTTSAKAAATAINLLTSTTGVTATATNTKTSAAITTTDAIAGTEFKINGTAIVSASGADVNAKTAALVAAINVQTGTTGVSALQTGTSGVYVLTASDGRNIDISSTLTGTVAGHSTSTDAAAFSGFTVSSGVSVTEYGKLTLASTAGATTIASAITGLTSGTTAVTAGSVLSISTRTTASAAITSIDAAISTVNSARASLGTVQSRFESVIANLQTSSENLSAARGRIRDADFAAETANLTRNQVLQQAGVAMLAQANALPNIVLSLLK